MGKKITILYPADTLLNESILFPKVFPFLDQYSDEFEIEIIGRIPSEQFKNQYKIKTKYIDFFKEMEKTPHFDKKLTDQEIAEQEEFLGVSFNFIILSNQRRWGWSRNPEELTQKLAKYVKNFRKLLEGRNIVISFLENLFFINCAEKVAQKLGIKLMKIGRSEIIKNGMIFWNSENDPIFYKKNLDLEAYEILKKRAKSARQTVKIDKSAMNNINRIVEKIPQIPEKINQIKNDRRSRMDIDVPPLEQKYKRLGTSSLRYLIYPTLHKLFFEHSKEGEKFFLLPLHYEWEAQIALREPFLNQLDLAKKIAQVLPQGTKLYVKVHPHWKNADQDLGPVRELKKIPGIKIIHPNENTMDLIEKSVGVIVINSTVGYEALTLNKTLIVVGHEIYRNAGIEVRDLNKMPEVLVKVKSRELKRNEQEIEEFLKIYTSHVIFREGNEQFTEEFRKVINSL